MTEVDINEILKEHVTLDIECIDRIYLNGYIPNLQLPGQVVNFLRQQGYPIPSPAILGKLTDEYKAAVEAFAVQHDIPLVHFARGVRKDDIAAEYRARHGEQEGVLFIGIAQERATAYKAHKRTQGQQVFFDYARESVYVNHYYFYLYDDDFGPAFIKVCTYAPYAVKICLNGHEWAKRQAHKRGLAFEALDNGFLSCTDAPALQAICDQLGPEQIQAFFDKWQSKLPWRLTARDREAGYQYRLSLWQVEFSRTQVFDDPARGRQWFEAIIRDNLDVGRPDRIQLVFEKRITQRTPGLFRTQVIADGVNPSLHAYYKKTHVKQYFKENRALRTETTINDARDFGSGKDITNLPFLQQLGRQINRRLLDAQHISYDCVLSAQSLERIVHPTVTDDGQRAPALRLGEPRVMALLSALTAFVHIPSGFTNHTLREQLADLLDADHQPYTAAQMSYDLRRLRLKGIIWRIPNSYRYQLTTYGRKVAVFFSKLETRVFRQFLAALDPAQPVPLPLASALEQVEQAVAQLVEYAHLSPAAA
ncbi:MAG: hypothetical protein WHS45_13335 [Anaerolinea sp.]